MMWALHRAALSNGIVPVIPAVAVAEGYRSEARSDRIGELQMPLNEPQRMADWQQAMRTRFKAMGLIDRLIHQLSG